MSSYIKWVKQRSNSWQTESTRGLWQIFRSGSFCWVFRFWFHKQQKVSLYYVPTDLSTVIRRRDLFIEVGLLHKRQHILCSYNHISCKKMQFETKEIISSL